MSVPALVLLGCVFPAAASAVPQTGITLEGLSAGVPTSVMDAQLNYAKQLHMSVVRTELRWSDMEPNGAGDNDPGVLAAADYFMSAATQRGLKVVLTVDGSPCWASSAPASVTNGCQEPYDHAGSQSYPPTNPGDFAPFAAFIANRYANALAGFEVWNEPDQANQLYFNGPDKPARYAALLRAAYPAIKQAAPGVPVLAPAIVGANGAFLNELYAAGIKGYYDALSVHYYDKVLSDLRSIRAVQAKNHDKTPIWLAEFGWASCYPGATIELGQTCVTPAVQADNIVDVLSAIRHTSWVKGAIVYDLFDDPSYQLGLLDVNLKPKPAFVAVQKALAKPPKVRRIRLTLKRSHGSVIASGSGPAADSYELYVYRGKTLRFKALFFPDRSNRFTLKLPAALGTHGLKVTVFQDWSRLRTTKRV